MRITVLVPAHNEAAQIAATIESLLAQTHRPEQIIVVADNCTDGTEALATAMGVQVLATEGNTHKKAGALNQALRLLLPGLAPTDAVLVMDADTAMVPDFLAVAASALERRPDLGAVGGIFQGLQPRGLLGYAQTNEYTRYAREIARTGRVMVLTGTASLVRVSALRAVAEARGLLLPGRPGDVYDRDALTEDNELTLALKTLGWSLLSPSECLTSTELMPTLGALHRQRLRWYRGALDNLATYGLTRVTARYWYQQVMLTIGTLTMALYLSLTVLDATTGVLSFNPWWALVGLIFWAERIVTAWRSPVRGRLLAALFVAEFGYDLFLQGAFIRAVWQHHRRTEAVWHHIEQGSTI